MELTCRPIGVIHTPYREPRGTPIQPTGALGVEGTVEVFPEYVQGLKDLDGFSHVILLYHFHLSGWCSLTVRPYMDKEVRGVFATRFPGRPNPIGLSVVRLKGVDGRVLRITDVDIVDGTPLARARLDSRLREMSYGEAEGRPQSWFRERIRPRPVDGDRLNHRVYEGAESRREVAERVGAALDDILERVALDTVIVTHGFASTFLVMAWMRVPAEHTGHCGLPSKPACVTKLHEDDFFRNRSVDYLCSISHLVC